MFSEHLIIFSCLSIRYPNIKNIFEIGTHDGRFANILSNLFPNTKINTIDLPSHDTDFMSTYSRVHNHKQFVNTRNTNLQTSKNITFKEINSLQLINYSESYDLI